MQLPKICAKAPRTVAGATRQYDAIIRKYMRAYADGGAFGFDMPTFRLNWPEGYAAAQRLASFANNPDNK